MDFSDFMLANSQAENVDFGSLAQQMMANLSGSGLDSLGTIEPVVTRSPASPTPMSRAQNGSLLGDMPEHPDEDAEDESTVRSRPTSTTEQLIIDLSTPLKRTSISSHRSSQRLSAHTTLSSASEPEGAEVDPPRSDESGDEAFATPENKPSSIFETLATSDAEDEAEGDDTVGDETIVAELSPSTSQIM